MKLYIIRVPGHRLTISAPDVWDAIEQAQAACPSHFIGSGRPA